MSVHCERSSCSLARRICQVTKENTDGVALKNSDTSYGNFAACTIGRNH